VLVAYESHASTGRVRAGGFFAVPVVRPPRTVEEVDVVKGLGRLNVNSLKSSLNASTTSGDDDEEEETTDDEDVALTVEVGIDCLVSAGNDVSISFPFELFVDVLVVDDGTVDLRGSLLLPPPVARRLPRPPPRPLLLPPNAAITKRDATAVDFGARRSTGISIESIIQTINHAGVIVMRPKAGYTNVTISSGSTCTANSTKLNKRTIVTKCCFG
jgi:hypothetical protein